MKRALVLQRQAYGESDLVVRFLLDTGEQVSGFARAAKKSRRRFPHQFHSSGIYDLDFKASSGRGELSGIQFCELKEFSESLSQDWEQWTRWSCILEWIRFHPETRFSFSHLRDLLLEAKPQKFKRAFFDFFWDQIQEAGLSPELSDCVVCRKPLQSPEAFSASEGGVCHLRCEPSAVACSKELVDYLRGLSMELSAKSFEELDRILIPLIETQLGVDLKSFRLLRRSLHTGYRDASGSTGKGADSVPSGVLL